MTEPDRFSPTTLPEPGAQAKNRRRWPALHWQILIGLIVGAVAGLVANRLGHGPDGLASPHLTWAIEYVAEPLGQIFLRLIFMVVLPLCSRRWSWAWRASATSAAGYASA